MTIKSKGGTKNGRIHSQGINRWVDGGHGYSFSNNFSTGDH